LKAALDYTHYGDIVAVRNISQLAKLNSEKQSDLSGHLLALRQQIHVRLYVYGVKKGALPLIGSGKGEAERTRLQDALSNLIRSEKLPSKPPPAPDPYLLRPQQRAPTKLAMRLDLEYMDRVASVMTEYKRLVDNGTFYLPRNSALADSDSDDDGDCLRARNDDVVTVPARLANVVIPGTVFDEDDVQWQVLSMEFSEEYNELLCYYFDVEMAKEQNISIDDMKKALAKDPPEELEPLERSKLSEVCKWIKEHKERIM
jgi:hypothetical protein